MTNNEQMSLGGFLGRAVPWWLVGVAAGLKGSKLALCTMLGPFGERVLGFSLQDVMVAYTSAMERERWEMEGQERLAQIRRVRESINLQPLLTTTQPTGPLSAAEFPQPDPAMPSGQKLVEIERDSKWRDVVVHPSVVLILGKRGSGKSALGYRLLELFRYGLTPYVLAVPVQAKKLLPDWMGIAESLEDIPPKSIVLVDEAYLRYHSRESQKGASKEMSRILSLSRQRDQTMIFVTPEARQIDKNIVSSSNVVVFKDLGMLQLEFDRPELSRIAAQAKQALETLKGDRRKWSYVYAPDADFMGLLENSLPTFWSSRLSHAFAAGSEASSTKLRKRMTLEGRIKKAKELRQGGLSLGQIAKMLGVSKPTVKNYLEDYPYRR